MNKIFKKLLIGILFAILAIPIVSKINVYAATLLDHTYANEDKRNDSTRNAIKIKNVDYLYWRWAASGSHETASFTVYAVNGSSQVQLFTGNTGGDHREDASNHSDLYTITPAQKSAYGEWYIYAHVSAGADGSHPSNYSAVDIYGTPTLSCNHYEAKEYYQFNSPPSGGTLLDYNESGDVEEGVKNTTLNATKITSADYVKWTFYVHNGRDYPVYIHVKAEKPGSSITLYECREFRGDNTTESYYFPITEGMKIAYSDYYINVYTTSGRHSTSKVEVYGSNSPTFTSGGTLTAVNLAYNGTTSKQYSVSANNASSYTWYLDGSPNPTGASGATYTANIANLSHGNHTLKCVANGSGGTTTSTNQITFNVNRTPVISSGNLM